MISSYEAELHQFISKRNIDPTCLEHYPGVVKMEYWLSRNPNFLENTYVPPRILKASRSDIMAAKRIEGIIEYTSDKKDRKIAYEDFDEAVMFELFSREDMIAFCNKSRELGFYVYAKYYNPDFVDIIDNDDDNF